MSKNLGINNIVPIGISMQELQIFRLMMLSKNLASAEIAGFRELYINGETTPRKVDKQTVSYIKASHVKRNLEVGEFKKTDDPLHVALGCKGWMMVQAPSGAKYYTRDGRFRLQEGNLVDSNGYKVLDRNQGIIQLGDDGEIGISSDGSISKFGVILQKLGIFDFENPQEIDAAGNNLLITSQEPKAVESPIVNQYGYEESNVSGVGQLIKLNDAQRRYEEAQKMLDIYDQEKKRLINFSWRNSM